MKRPILSTLAIFAACIGLVAFLVIADNSGRDLRVNVCKCDKPCGAVKCEPGMRYEWPKVFPKLPE